MGRRLARPARDARGLRSRGSEGLRSACVAGIAEPLRVFFHCDAPRAIVPATMRYRSLRFSLISTLLLAGTTLPAQEPGAPVAHKTLGPAYIIMPHITDSKTVELPCVKGWSEWACEWTLPTWNVRIGNQVIDLGPTKHVVFLLLAAILTGLVVILAARSHVRSTERIGRPQGFAAGLEAVILYLRNEIFMPVLGGHGGERYIPLVLSLFFFILFCNLFGLVPYGSTPTGNVSVTAALALLTFVVVEAAGVRALGRDYVGTIIYWPHDDMRSEEHTPELQSHS